MVFQLFNDTSCDFKCGVFSCMQYLVLERDEPSFAKELAALHGINREWALAESNRTGYCVRKMNMFIRAEIKT